MRSIFEISQDYQALLEQIDAQDGEITQEQEKLFELCREDYEKKAEAYLYVIKHKETRIEEAKKVIEQAKKVIEREEKQIDFLKSILLKAVNLFGKTQTTLYTLSKRKSVSVEIESLELLPKEFLIEQVHITADKKSIKEALQNGKEIKGAYLKEQENLQIK